MVAMEYPNMYLFTMMQRFCQLFDEMPECHTTPWVAIITASIVVLDRMATYAHVIECRVASGYEKVGHPVINCRKWIAILTDFGGVDGKTSSTKVFSNVSRNPSQYAYHNGALLVVPYGKWLIERLNLTNHLTIFHQNEVVILTSQDELEWPSLHVLASYERGRDAPIEMFSSLNFETSLTVVVVWNAIVHKCTCNGNEAVEFDLSKELNRMHIVLAQNLAFMPNVDNFLCIVDKLDIHERKNEAKRVIYGIQFGAHSKMCGSLSISYATHGFEDEANLHKEKDNDFIAPSKYVHQVCLDHWLSVKKGFAFACCNTCVASYHLCVYLVPHQSNLN
ncbi:hypothetical protein TSUD_358340 [Trifolium subterraneum]|uniref:Pectate lyase superfamily protein domain-containing protein n=1 Tax=Trifolium subterraneum TaxID=3900 RepID=A0A2Z6NSJ0_TRISU|nr:hypothetical protein TSUD_358340 [Trifolium subterraneum]